MEKKTNGYLRWWQFFITVVVLLVGILGSYFRMENTANNTQKEFFEFKIETKETLQNHEIELDNIGEIKMNLKQLMNHFDLKYIED